MVVPAEVCWEYVPKEITEDNMEVALAWAHGFNQCRAAMLNQAPVNQQSSNGTLTNEGNIQDDAGRAGYRSEWIECNERLPETVQSVLVFIDFDGTTLTPLIKDAVYTGSTFRVGRNTVNVTGEPAVTH